MTAYLLHRGDHLAVVLTVAWAAESLNNVSVYTADAQAMAVPLFGDDGSGAGHDYQHPRPAGVARVVRDRGTSRPAEFGATMTRGHSGCQRARNGARS